MVTLPNPLPARRGYFVTKGLRGAYRYKIDILLESYLNVIKLAVDQDFSMFQRFESSNESEFGMASLVTF